MAHMNASGLGGLMGGSAQQQIRPDQWHTTTAGTAIHDNTLQQQQQEMAAQEMARARMEQQQRHAGLDAFANRDGRYEERIIDNHMGGYRYKEVLDKLTGERRRYAIPDDFGLGGGSMDDLCPPQPSRPKKKKKLSGIEELREEVENWCGDALTMKN